MTKKLSFRRADPFAYPEDVERMVIVLREAGYECSAVDAHNSWQAHSDHMCATWMMLPDDDDILVATLLENLVEDAP